MSVDYFYVVLREYAENLFHLFGVGFALHREFFAHLVVSEMPAPFARLYKSLNFAIYLFA